MTIETLLNEEIKAEFEELKKIELGTEEYKTTVDGVTKLVDRAIELEKINIEQETKIENQEFDRDFKLKQMERDQKNQLIGNAIAVGGIIIPVVVTIWGTLKSFEFEKEGTITTIMGRGFINKLLPRK